MHALIPFTKDDYKFAFYQDGSAGLLLNKE